MDSHTAVSSYAVHHRVEDLEGFRGTVRYIGPVAAAKNQADIWLGIEWDDPTRGKHDGSCLDAAGNSVRHFSCPMGSGSFIKPNKLKPGKSFEQALRERYVAMDAPEEAPGDIVPDAYVLTSSGVQKSIEFVGEQKIRKWQQIDVLNKVTMRNCSLSSAGGDILSFAGHFTELDLQDNLLSGWEEVGKMASQMPLLRSFMLHGNKMEPVGETIGERLPSGCFQSLRVLALNGCGLRSWREVLLLERYLPNIEELYLAANDFSDLNSSMETGASGKTDFSSTGFQNLHILDVAATKLSSWEQILSFSRLPNLEELVLDGNAIPSVSPCPPDSFGSLKRISASSTGLSSWSDVDAISTYPSVAILRLAHIPLFVGRGASEVRPLVIGRIASLVLFNGSTVSLKERQTAEKVYLRQATAEKTQLEKEQQPGATVFTLSEETAAEFALKHPRFAELSEKYAHDIISGSAAADAGSSIGADLLSIVLNNVSYSGATGQQCEPITKRIPSSLTVGRLKLMVKQLFGLDPIAQQLSMRDGKDVPPTLLDDDEATLRYCGAVNGSEVFINETDVV